MNALRAIDFKRDDPNNVSVSVLDQLLLPYTTKYIPIYTIDDGFTVIKKMQVRGAPAIAIVGALSVLMESQLLLSEGFCKTQYYYNLNDWENIRSKIDERLAFLLSSRPTAINLSNALDEIKIVLNSASDLQTFKNNLFDYVCKLIDDDFANNKRMGDNGAEFLLNLLKKENFNEDFAVFTICNTGSLATSGYGTALGVIRSLWNDSKNKTQEGNPNKKVKLTESSPKMVQVFPLETRPYNQGSRLTAYELVHDDIPATLIPDSSIAYKIMTSKIPIKAAFVGADRIVRNGDTANKIGTLQLAIICKQFGIKFFVVAPRTTIDKVTEEGKDVIVEERNANEFKIVTGSAVDMQTNKPILDEKNEPITAKVGIAPENINVWNPAFDITSFEYIDGIVTEVGVFTKNENGNFDLSALH
ncbi:Initiation factor 2 subunit family [Nakaseomyces glabratus]|nr:Initiation factor 2 subunit family [Nakaseomyces glabratus]KAH7606556.1 Initiation factor 2 subunit family [Nakaseomyces glabratus]KAH7614698.1 Initiation factor 2 subunit family [Nakaseomyces glabratus]